MTITDDSVHEAFAQGLLRAAPASVAAAVLVISEDFDAAEAAARAARTHESDIEPMVAIAIARAVCDADTTLAEEVRVALARELVEGRIGSDEVALLRAVLDTATLHSNEPARESVYSIESACDVARRLSYDAPIHASDLAHDGPLAPLPTLRAWATAHANDPREVARVLRADENAPPSLAMAVDLFATGRPELALLDARNAVELSDVGLWCWWLAAVQSGTIRDDLDLILDGAAHNDDAHSALLAESATQLGHRDPSNLPPGLDPAWAASIRARRRGNSHQVSGTWRLVARTSDAVVGTPLNETFEEARVLLQQGDWEAASRGFALAAELSPDDARHAQLLVAAAYVSAMTDGGIDYSVRYADAAVARSPRSLAAATAVLDLALRTSAPWRDAADRIESILDSPPGEFENAERVELAADAYARSRGSNDAGRILLERAVDAAPDTTHRWIALSEFHARLGNMQRAAATLEEAARTEKRSKERAEIYARVGAIYEDHLQQRLPALENYLVSFVCFSGSATTFERLESIYVGLERFRDLASAYELAVAFARRNPDQTELDVEGLLLRKAEVELRRLDRPERAGHAFAELTKLRPQEPYYVSMLAEHLAPHVDAKTIRDAIESHVASLPDDAAKLARSRFAGALTD